MGECDGKVAFITGASRGIGRAIARRFAAEGASVVLSASRLGAHGDLKGTLEEAVSEIQAAGGKASAVTADLSQAGPRSGLVERASEAFGPIDILVNNAGSGRMMLPSEATTEDRNYMFLEEARHFLKCVREGAQPLVDGADGLKTLRCLLAGIESSNTRRFVAVEE